jgi:hypothetical protein
MKFAGLKMQLGRAVLKGTNRREKKMKSYLPQSHVRPLPVPLACAAERRRRWFNAA